ncbi:MAG: hypothetical protein HYY84_14345 [Deltaproteobacteria bacterium]|nr:hypothetical protein [Deltaproteobacteria bacterium]
MRLIKEICGDFIKFENDSILEDPGTARQLILQPEEKRDDFFRRLVGLGRDVFVFARDRNDGEILKGVVREVEDCCQRIPRDVAEKLISILGQKGEGPLSEVTSTVDRVRAVLEKVLGDVQGTFANELDPRGDKSTLGRALLGVRNLLDAERVDSVQQRVQREIESISKSDGRLSTAVRESVRDEMRVLAERIGEIEKTLLHEAGVRETVNSTTLKGKSFEERVVDELQPFAKMTGAQITHVGGDNRPGDVLVENKAGCNRSVKIVIEAKDRTAPFGRKAISEILDNAIRERNATAAIYVSPGIEGLAREIGDWAEGVVGEAPWVATTQQFLQIAVRFVVAQAQQQGGRMADPSVLRPQLARLRLALRGVSEMRKKITAIHDGANGIEEQITLLKDGAETALSEMEKAIETHKEEVK